MFLLQCGPSVEDRRSVRYAVDTGLHVMPAWSLKLYAAPRNMSGTAGLGIARECKRWKQQHPAPSNIYLSAVNRDVCSCYTRGTATITAHTKPQPCCCIICSPAELTVNTGTAAGCLADSVRLGTTPDAARSIAAVRLSCWMLPC
jgi:hypothetical protein